ncbi:MAG TPA: glycosyltransferase [Longimicrobiales bacterium]
MPVILHVITTINGGGAEAALRRLVLADRANTHHVVSLTGGGAPDLVAGGVAVETLDMPAGTVTRRGLARLARLIRQLQPNVIQTWMYHADLVGGVVARTVSKAPVLWGIRNAYLDKPLTSARTRAVARACALLSHVVPARIVSCSQVAAQLHVERGYARAKMRVIANGYDQHELAPDAAGRAALRAEWQIGPDTMLLGMVARWDAQKDHRNLIAALAQLRAQQDFDWRCALIGGGMTAENLVLVQLLAEAGIRDRVLLCGARSSVSALMSALDLHVLSSCGEAFPNVVAEAMACGTPCVVTAVGDAALIVGETGWVVPARDPRALAAAISAAAAELADPQQRAARQQAARARITGQFNIDRMVRGYQDLWTEVAIR